MTGFLAFLFAREARLQKTDKTKGASPIDVGEVRPRVGGPTELDDEQRPFEAGGNGVSELLGTAAQIVPKF